MALFKIPKRTETSIDNILTKVATEETPKIKLKGTSLLSKIDMIRQTVEKNLGSAKGSYLLIDNDEQWLNYCTKVCNSDYVAYDTECSSLDTMKAKLAGICIKATGLPSAYVTVGHISPITEKLLPNQVSISAIRKGLEMFVKAGAKFLMHNSYFDVVLTYQQTGVMLPVYFDTLVCAELLNENEPHGLKYLYAKYCKQSDNFHKFAELFDGIPINLIPPEIAGIYGQFDAIMTYDLALWQMPYVTHGTPECNRYKLDGVADLFWNIDMRMIEVLVSMRLEGLKFDFEKAKELKIKYSKLRDEAEQNFNQAVEKYKNDILDYIASHPNTQLEYPINYNSPIQLKTLFYDIAKIPKGLYRREPTGTGKNVINVILNTPSLKKSPIYDIVKALSDVKMYDKAISSFIDKLTEDAKEHDGKIHCSFNLSLVDTGRLSCSQPNLQQCISKLGDIRNMFTAGENRVFIGCDFSKQEPCMLASSCMDKDLIKTFTDGLDIYSKIASMIYPDYSYEECLEHYPDGSTNKEGKKRRSVAKKVVLSLLYGKGKNTLCEDLGCNMEEVNRIFDNVYGAYPTMKQWMDEMVAKAYEQGYVDNIYGRRRRLPDLKLPKFTIEFAPFTFSDADEQYYRQYYTNALNKAYGFKVRQGIIDEARTHGIIINDNESKIKGAERKIINFCIQGSASCTTKLAMLNLYHNKRLRELGCRLVLSIHDENVLTCPKEHAYEASKLIEELSIAGGEGLPVAMSCDLAISDVWYGEEYAFDDNHNLIKRG